MKKTYFLVVVSLALAEVSVDILDVESFFVESDDILELESVLIFVESEAAVPLPPLLQAANAPIAKTKRNFFIVFIFLFVN
jgi:hypothetical protein